MIALKLVFETIFSDSKFVVGSLVSIGIWSSICAYGVFRLDQKAQEDHHGTSAKWLEIIAMGRDPLRVIGSLFGFALVFRFKICYDRWWEGRQLWGQIITGCLDLAIQINRWMANQDIVDRFNRFLVVYCYACKNILGHKSLVDSGDGEKMIIRRLLTRNELKEIQDYPCWEPHFCLEVMRELLSNAYLVKGGFYLEEAKMHSQVYRCFDNSIKDLNDRIGQCIAVQSSELPEVYDGLHLFAFTLYFTAAPVIWATTMLWVVIPMSLLVSFIALGLIKLGTELVDPFGDDEVDIPLESFCLTIEQQIDAIIQRRARGKFKELVATEKTKVMSA